MDYQTITEFEVALDRALEDIKDAKSEDFRRLKMGEYRGLKIAVAMLGLVLKEADGRHYLMEATQNATS